MHEKITAEATRIKSNYLDNAIREKLKEKGHEFENNQELAEFLAARCGLTQTTKGLSVFYLDKEPLFQWWDTYRWESKEVNGELKYFCTYGLPPEKSGTACERGYIMETCIRREHSIVGCAHCRKPILN